MKILNEKMIRFLRNSEKGGDSKEDLKYNFQQHFGLSSHEVRLLISEYKTLKG